MGSVSPEVEQDSGWESACCSQAAWAQTLPTRLPGHMAVLGTGLLGGLRWDSGTGALQGRVRHVLGARQAPALTTPDGPFAVSLQGPAQCRGTLVTPSRGRSLCLDRVTQFPDVAGRSLSLEEFFPFVRLQLKYLDTTKETYLTRLVGGGGRSGKGSIVSMATVTGSRTFRFPCSLLTLNIEDSLWAFFSVFTQQTKAGLKILYLNLRQRTCGAL